ncbi:hypothetical protein B0H11DRAFT_1868568 [Mycena galericulata]|nr:hypothetical protein B0H11DRAFT_1868568 [Mycena galericulata]
MIITEEKHDSSNPSSPSLSPASRYASVPSRGYYNDSSFAPSTSNGSSSGSGLRPPPQWHPTSSETALPVSSPPQFPALSPTHSHTYIATPPSQPSSFSRRPPYNLPKTTFQPMFLFAEENSLKKGFPCVPPPSTSHPHPFELFDINETDWAEFLDDLRVMARLSPQDRTQAECVPIVSALPLINIVVGSAIRHHLRRQKPRLVSLLVDKWNHHFFHPRGIEVILMRGQNKLSGQSDQPVPSLYTPRTVNFTPPPLDDSDAPDKHGHHHASGGDKTYRLFVVSMEG